MSITACREFTAPSRLPLPVLLQAEALWSVATDDTDDVLADLLGLGPADGHDELTRCDNPDCRAWFWADEGATVHYESGAVLTVCAAHAVADDPGARVYPGYNLLTAWQRQWGAEMRARIGATGSAW